MIKFLTDNGGDFNISKSYKSSPFLHLCGNASISIDFIQFAIQNKADLNLKDGQGDLALHYALKSNIILEKVKYLGKYLFLFFFIIFYF